MFKWLRRLFYTRLKKVELIPDKQYLWIFDDILMPQKLKQLQGKIKDARMHSVDIITDARFKVIPASSLKLTLEHSEFKSKTQLMKMVSAALGKGKDWKNVAKIELDEGILKVEKYYAGEENGKPGRNSKKVKV